jgi:hypothetical protein
MKQFVNWHMSGMKPMQALVINTAWVRRQEQSTTCGG